MSIKKITEYPIAPNLGDENYLLGTVDGETKRISNELIGTHLPTPTSADIGKAIMVGEDGQYQLIDPKVIIDEAIGDEY